MRIKSEVRIAVDSDLDQIKYADYLYDEKVLKEKIGRKEIIVCDENGQITGILRYMLFGDYLPFINFIWVEEGFREEHRATRMVEKLIEEMGGKENSMIMTSTQANKGAQNFFRKIGFEDAGGFVMKGQPYELLMIKYVRKAESGSGEH